MENVILPGEPLIEVTLRPSTQARRLSLRVSRLDGRVTLSLPKRARRAEAVAFIHEKADWIRRNFDATPAPVLPRPGGEVLFAGRMYQLMASGGRAAKLGDGVIHLPVSTPERTGARLTVLFKLHARQRLGEASDRYAAALGQKYSGISLRDTRSRWGSCSTEGRLMYSWRLIMAPPEVLDYVAAHEVAHLAEMNHSPAYWAGLARLMPDYKAPRLWLRKNGGLLHAVRFRD